MIYYGGVNMREKVMQLFSKEDTKFWLLMNVIIVVAVPIAIMIICHIAEYPITLSSAVSDFALSSFSILFNIGVYIFGELPLEVPPQDVARNRQYRLADSLVGYLKELRENTKRYKRGISNEQACIVVAADDEKNLIAKPVSVGRLETEDVKKLLSGHFDSDSTLITDSHSAYPILAKSENIRHVQIKADKHTEGRYNLANVNGIHSQIEKFMPESAERIPATKYLNQYMALFTWQWIHKGLSLDERVILLKRTLADSWDDYKESYDSIKSRPLDINTKGQFPNVV